MKNSEFDKYMKSLSEEELTPPTELDWDFMDIPIPKERKKKKIFLILFITLLGGIMSMFLLNINEEDETLSAKKMSDENLEDKKENDLVSNKIIQEDDIKESSNLETKNNLVQSKTPEKYSNPTRSIVNNQIDSRSNETFEYKRIEINNNEPIIGYKKVDNQISKYEIVTVEKKQINNSNEQKKLIQKEEKINELFDKNLNELVTKTISEFAILNDKKKILLLKTKRKFPLSLSLSYGFNISKNKYSSAPQASLMNKSEDTSYGNSYSLDLGFRFKNNLLLKGGISFHQLHTTFYFEEDLGFVNDFSTFTRTYSTRKVFHNNYSEFIELNLGTGFRMPIHTRFHLDLIASLNPGLRISSKGRILNDDSEIVHIEDNLSNQKMILNAGVNLKLSYQLKKLSLDAGFGYAHALNKTKLLDDSNLSTRPQRFVFNLGLTKNF